MTKVHFLGIGGSGTSAAAAIAQAQGYEISGCDLNPQTEFTTKFSKSQLSTGHSPAHLKDIDILAITPAVTSLDPGNGEVQQSQRKKIETLTWQEFTGKYLQKDKIVIAVSGTHGKSTTTAMISKILEDANLDPTVILGAIVPSWKRNFRVGKGKIFLIEADEFNDNFLSYHPDISVVTNIEMDHPEYFKDFRAVTESFRKFFNQTKNTIIANISDPGVAKILKIFMKESSVTCLDYAKHEINLNLQVPGDFNNLNASAAFQVGLLLGIDSQLIRKSLESYQGLGRRFEKIGTFEGAAVFSDFGHHPTEIKTTMEAARKEFAGKKIWLIYEPHMFTRTKALFNSFVGVFKKIPVDRVIVTDIYPSREIDKGVVNSKQLVAATNSANVEYQSKDQLKDVLQFQVEEDDVIFFMGAGDIDKIARELVKTTH